MKKRNIIALALATLLCILSLSGCKDFQTKYRNKTPNFLVIEDTEILT